jgi:hypothetical protein
MEDATTNCAAFDETVVFLSHFKDLKDPRQQGKITYPLDEILLLCLLAVLAGAETFVEDAILASVVLDIPLSEIYAFADMPEPDAAEASAGG